MERAAIRMTVHLIKLCVGVDTVQELQAWQAERIEHLRKLGKVPEHCHRTMQTPRRRDEVLDGGSLYWVIRGVILVRQRVLDLRPDEKDDGVACCGIVLEPKLVATRARGRRAFQGWRYLAAADAPADARTFEAAQGEMPQAMREDLLRLGLIDW
jgi:hypothetical protein